MPLVATRGGASAFGLGWSAAGAGEELGGMVLLTPTSIAYSGTSASIGTNGSVEFTACTSLSLNGVFSADYDNYMIAIQATSPITTGKTFRLRSSGTDASGNDYNQQYVLANGTGISANRSASVNTGRGCAVYATQNTGDLVNIYGPYLAQTTAFRNISASDNAGAMIQDYVNTHSLSTSYDGFSMLGTSSDLTGLVSVYGLVGA